MNKLTGESNQRYTGGNQMHLLIQLLTGLKLLVETTFFLNTCFDCIVVLKINKFEKSLIINSHFPIRFHAIAKFHLQCHRTNLNRFQTLFPGALVTLFSLTDELEFVPCSTGEVSLLPSFSLASLRVASSSCLARSFSSSCLDRSC